MQKYFVKLAGGGLPVPGVAPKSATYRRRKFYQRQMPSSLLHSHLPPVDISGVSVNATCEKLTAEFSPVAARITRDRDYVVTDNYLDPNYSPL